MAGKGDRTVPMQVLSLGFPRTGTASMQAALRLLGYSDVHHGFVLVDQPNTAHGWAKIVDDKYDRGILPDREAFDTVLGNYAAITDSPSVFFADELLLSYPKAKVVLIERNIDKWYDSFLPLAEGMFGWKGSSIEQFDLVLGYAGLRSYRKLWRGYFGAKDLSELLENAKPVYKEHYERVRKSVPPERLLNYDFGSGWKPLCNFLDKEVPEVEFPRVNEADALQKKMRAVVLTRFGEVCLKLLWPLVGLLAAVVALYLFSGWSARELGYTRLQKEWDQKQRFCAYL